MSARTTSRPTGDAGSETSHEVPFRAGAIHPDGSSHNDRVEKHTTTPTTPPARKKQDMKESPAGGVAQHSLPEQLNIGKPTFDLDKALSNMKAAADAETPKEQPEHEQNVLTDQQIEFM